MVVQNRSTKSIKNKTLSALAVAGAMTLPALSAQATVAETNCCTSGPACEQMINELQAACRGGQSSLYDTCTALQGLTAYEWLLNNADLSPLDKENKDFAGTYQLSLDTFVMTNKWLKTDAPGIKSNGQSNISVRKICYDTESVEIKAKVNVFVSFQLYFKTKVQKVQGAKGYYATGTAQGTVKSYFFTPVSSQRTLLDIF